MVRRVGGPANQRTGLRVPGAKHRTSTLFRDSPSCGHRSLFKGPVRNIVLARTVQNGVFLGHADPGDHGLNGKVGVVWFERRAGPWIQSIARLWGFVLAVELRHVMRNQTVLLEPRKLWAQAFRDGEEFGGHLRLWLVIRTPRFHLLTILFSRESMYSRSFMGWVVSRWSLPVAA